MKRRARPPRGLLLTFEGIDGSGKTTQVRLLKAHLEEEGHAPLVVRDPGGVPLAERLRALLLDTAQPVDPMAELLLFSAARAQLTAQRLRPALAAGRVVLCDRFYDSTTAYQGAGRGVMEPAALEALHRRVTGGLAPDRTYLVELSPEAAAARRRAARPLADRMETSDAAFYARVAAAYAALAARHPARFCRLDGMQPAEAIQSQIRADVRRLLGASAGTASQGGGSSR